MTDYVAIVREPYLSMLANGTKRAECRVGSSRPHPAARCQVGDTVHLRPVGGAPVVQMRVTRVELWGRCARAGLRRIADARHSALGGTDRRHPYLTDRDSGYPCIVWLSDPKSSALTTWPRYATWARVRA